MLEQGENDPASLRSPAIQVRTLMPHLKDIREVRGWAAGADERYSEAVFSLSRSNLLSVLRREAAADTHLKRKSVTHIWSSHHFLPEA